MGINITISDVNVMSAVEIGKLINALKAFSGEIDDATMVDIEVPDPVTRADACDPAACSMPITGPVSSETHVPFAGAEITVKKRTRKSRSEEHTSELQSRLHLVCRLL